LAVFSRPREKSFVNALRFLWDLKTFFILVFWCFFLFPAVLLRNVYNFGEFFFPYFLPNEEILEMYQKIWYII